MPSNRAPSPDGVVAEILKLGGQALASVMNPLYRTTRAWGMIPSSWNTAVVQLMWKAKGRRDNIVKYRPIALASSIFRKLKIMGSIRRRASGLGSVSGLSSSSNDLEAYVDYFSEFFAANGAKREEDNPYIILSGKYWLTHDTLSGMVGVSLITRRQGFMGFRQK